LVQLQKDLSEFVALLNSLNVEFVIVDGHAVAFHGHPRFTGDIDFLVNPSKDNAERVLAVPEGGYSLIDCTSVVVMTARGIELALTTDRHPSIGWLPVPTPVVSPPFPTATLPAPSRRGAFPQPATLSNTTRLPVSRVC
jgi:hypothetical protein